jgi:hypothetical protein
LLPCNLMVPERQKWPMTGHRPELAFQLSEFSSAVISIAEVLISSGAPDEINLGLGDEFSNCLTIFTTKNIIQLIAQLLTFACYISQ